MTTIYFVNKQHEINFKKTLLRWPVAERDSEYKSACYILSIPMIFEKVESYLDSFEYPVSWIYRWEWKYNLSKMEKNKDEDYDSEYDEIPYDLTGSMIQLGKLSLHLWNSYKYFHLLDCISSLDAENYNAAKCAIDIRMRKIELSNNVVY